MKPFPCLIGKLSTAATAGILGAAMLADFTASANPFASCISVTNIGGTNFVNFYLNESGGSVVVTYEDGTTNSTFDGVLTGTNVTAGLQSFSMNGHTGYTITCHKVGTGTPFQINAAGGAYYAWGTPRGVDANKNPKFANTFGRVYNGEGSYDSANRRYQGIYMLSPDLSTNLAPLGGTNPMAGGVWSLAAAAGSASAPYHITVGSDNNVYVADYASADATIYQFDATFSQYTNVVLGPIGETQGYSAGTHGDPTGVYITGSLATSNLVVYTFDPDLPISQSAALWYVDIFGNNIYHTGSEGQTTPGFFNNVLQYQIGAGLTNTNIYGGLTLWTNGPDKGVCLGLPTFQDSQIGDVAVETNGYIIAEYPRANFSDGDIQVYDTNFNLIYTSLQPNGTDPFNASGSRQYGGIRISPDNQYMLGVTIANQINVCFLTNGIPDVSSLIPINTVSATGNSRGCGFDAADNIIFNSSGAGKLEYYSLGYTSTTVYSNDLTGTNGTFTFTLPPVTASLAISQPTASQNYIATGGTPTPAVFNISLNTNSLGVPVTVNYSLTGPATNGVNFTINTGTNADGVIIKTNSVTFPAAAYPGGGNWTATVTVTPTALPLSGPTFTESLILRGGTTYIPAEPVSGYLTILNTGPQQLALSAVTGGNTMNRAVANDYAEFIITRYGDLSVPQYTVTNFNYGGSAVFGVDYTAGAQTLTTTPIDGSPFITVPSGASSFTNIVGNPVPRTPSSVASGNVTIALSLTNALTGTNLTSQEGVAYSVIPATVILTELDNSTSSEVVLWSNPLTNAADSSNWTLTFASTALNATQTVLPVVVPNYSGFSPDAIGQGGTNDYQVTFGKPVAADNIPVSPTMAAKGWTTALKATVENNQAAPAGVNVFPQGVNFVGNYAFRFSMYLQLFDRAVANPYYSGTVDRQYALFGIDAKGTNCSWRPTANVVPGTGSGMTNSDGIWFAIDAGIDAQTPADFDAFTTPPLPNSGPTPPGSTSIADFVSNTGEANSGIFKNPPFGGVISRYGTFGGEPVNQWVDVSVETSSQTNISLYMNHALVLSTFAIPTAYSNGVVMLGYENPLPNVSDGSAFVYYSNARVVELSPFITSQPVGKIITAGQSVTFNAAATYATAPLTNTWYLGYTNPGVALQTTSVAGTNMTDTLTLNNLLSGTNYFAVFADAAGSVTSLLASVEVITGPTNITAPAGSTVTFSLTASGQSAPTLYHWKYNGVNVNNSTTYAGATNAILTITNVLVSGTYSCGVTNAFGSVTPSAILTVVPPTPPVIASTTVVGTNMVFAFTSADPVGATNKFKLLSSPVVNGPYTTNNAAIVTGTAGSYQIVVPKTTNATMFYRLEDVN